MLISADKTNLMLAEAACTVHITDSKQQDTMDISVPHIRQDLSHTPLQLGELTQNTIIPVTILGEVSQNTQTREPMQSDISQKNLIALHGGEVLQNNVQVTAKSVTDTYQTAADIIPPEFSPADCRLSTPLKTSTMDNIQNSDTVNSLVSLDSTVEIKPAKMPAKVYGTKKAYVPPSEDEKPEQAQEVEEKPQRVSKRKAAATIPPTAAAPSIAISTRSRPRRSCQKKKDPNFVYFAPSGEAIVSPAKAAAKQEPPAKRRSTRASKSTAPAPQPQIDHVVEPKTEVGPPTAPKQEAKPQIPAKKPPGNSVVTPRVVPPVTSHEVKPLNTAVCRMAVVVNAPLPAAVVPPSAPPIQSQLISNAAESRKADCDYHYSDVDTEDADDTDYSLPSLRSEPGTSKPKKYPARKMKKSDPDFVMETEDTLVEDESDQEDEAEGSMLSQPFSDYSLPSIGVDEEIVGWSQVDTLPDNVLVRVFKYLNTKTCIWIISR